MDVPRRADDGAGAGQSGSCSAVLFGGDGSVLFRRQDGAARPWPAQAIWADQMCKKISANPSRRSWREWVSTNCPTVAAAPESRSNRTTQPTRRAARHVPRRRRLNPQPRIPYMARGFVVRGFGKRTDFAEVHRRPRRVEATTADASSRRSSSDAADESTGHGCVTRGRYRQVPLA